MTRPLDPVPADVKPVLRKVVLDYSIAMSRAGRVGLFVSLCLHRLKRSISRIRLAFHQLRRCCKHMIESFRNQFSILIDSHVFVIWPRSLLVAGPESLQPFVALGIFPEPDMGTTSGDGLNKVEMFP